LSLVLHILGLEFAFVKNHPAGLEGGICFGKTLPVFNVLGKPRITVAVEVARSSYDAKQDFSLISVCLRTRAGDFLGVDPELIELRLSKLFVALILIACPLIGHSEPAVLNPNLQIRLVLNTTNASGANSVRIVKNPHDGQLYYLKINGDVFRVNPSSDDSSTSTRVYSAADHGLSSSVLGIAFGPDGTLFLVGNTPTSGNYSNIGQIAKGVLAFGGSRAWSFLAQTEPYPKSGGAFDHSMSGIVVSPDGSSVFVNSGSRTDHGEVESNGGRYPNVREVGLTAKTSFPPRRPIYCFLTM
jgi:hypothetical protein